MTMATKKYMELQSVYGCVNVSDEKISKVVGFDGIFDGRWTEWRFLDGSSLAANDIGEYDIVCPCGSNFTSLCEDCM